MSEQELVGVVKHYYSKIGVAIVELSSGLRVGDRIFIEGKTTKLEQNVESMQLEHINIDVATAGQSIGLKVNKEVKENDKIYRVI